MNDCLMSEPSQTGGEEKGEERIVSASLRGRELPSKKIASLTNNQPTRCDCYIYFEDPN